MVDLTANMPANGMTPVEIGTTALREVDLGALTLLAPFKGRDADLAKAFKDAHGLVWPKPNRSTGKEGARAIWFGHRMILLAGPNANDALRGLAAVTDQSDAWVALRLDGPSAEDVLARLTPLDLRASEFKRGHTARSSLLHMPVSTTRVASQGFLILSFRSFADTLVHDVTTAMHGVAIRGSD